MNEWINEQTFCKLHYLNKFTGKKCTRVFSNKDAGLQPAAFLKRDSNTAVLLWILQIF